METPRFERLKLAFQELLEASPEERATALERLTREDAEFGAELGAWLTATERGAGEWLETPAVLGLGDEDQNERPGVRVAGPEATASLAPGERLGPYRIERELGRGGMGVVFLAVRDDGEFERRVAIKVVRADRAGALGPARLRAECKILALLDDPRIAQLYDSGSLADGSPYFVMEHVEGQPLDRWCAAVGASVEERLRLVIEICGAVETAHRRLVVHRDLKPGNILVRRGDRAGAAAEPKLLDFGIAKLLREEAAPGDDAAPMTVAERPLTPDYACLELLRGEPVTTSFDVYALGVLLYQLLSGQLPYRRRGGGHVSASLAAVEARLAGEAPEAPSRVAPPAMRRRLSGDLDTIVLMAMHAEPARRYGSVGELAEDLRRHLEGLPVAARRDHALYRARKFARRHRLALAAAAAVVLALTVGLAATLWQARVADAQRARAEARFNDVRKLARTILFEMHDAIAPLPGSTQARQVLVGGALEYLDGLAREAGDDASLQRELANAYDRVADVQGSPTTPSLGDLKGALATYRKAQSIRALLEPDASADPQIRRELSATGMKLAFVLFYSGDPAGATEQARQSAEIEESLSVADRTPAQLVRLGDSYARYGYLVGGSGKTLESLALLRRATALLEPVVATSAPEDVKAREALAGAYGRLGEILEGGNAVPGVVPDIPAALAAYDQALALDEALLRLEPVSVSRRRNLVVDHVQIGQAKERAADPAGALGHYRLALPIIESLSAEDPANLQARADLASVCQKIGTLLVRGGDARGAAPFLERALRLLAEAVQKDPASLLTRVRVAETHRGLGHVHATLGAEKARGRDQRAAHLREAKDHFAKSLEFWTEAVARGLATGEENAKPRLLAAEIAACDRALAALAVER